MVTLPENLARYASWAIQGYLHHMSRKLKEIVDENDPDYANEIAERKADLALYQKALDCIRAQLPGSKQPAAAVSEPNP